jgi:uncharacterized protein YegL
LFVEPKADGGTPMDKAFVEARQIAEKFIEQHRDSFPPIVINITDGQPDDMNLASMEAEKLVHLSTNDGNILLMNVHIPEKETTYLGRIELPQDDLTFQSNDFAKFLFRISSTLPSEILHKAARVGLSAKPNSKAFMFNAEPKSLVKMLNFGSMGAFTR